MAAVIPGAGSATNSGGGSGIGGGGGGADGVGALVVLPAKQQSFLDVMNWIGVNADMRRAINDEGFHTLRDQVDIAESQIDKLVKHGGH
jgi:hypothetical protein